MACLNKDRFIFIEIAVFQNFMNNRFKNRLAHFRANVFIILIDKFVEKIAPKLGGMFYLMIRSPPRWT